MFIIFFPVLSCFVLSSLTGASTMSHFPLFHWLLSAFPWAIVCSTLNHSKFYRGPLSGLSRSIFCSTMGQFLLYHWSNSPLPWASVWSTIGLALFYHVPLFSLLWANICSTIRHCLLYYGPFSTLPYAIACSIIGHFALQWATTHVFDKLL